MCHVSGARVGRSYSASFLTDICLRSKSQALVWVETESVEQLVVNLKLTNSARHSNDTHRASLAGGRCRAPGPGPRWLLGEEVVGGPGDRDILQQPREAGPQRVQLSSATDSP